MKNFIYTFIALLFCAGISAQAPEGFKYQAVARDASGTVITGQTVGMQVSILKGSMSGTPVYLETFTPSTNQFGLLNLEIGSGTVVSGDFSGIDWGNDSYFIKVEMDASGGTSYMVMGTSQLLSVPYALHAKAVDSITEADPVFGTSVAGGITASDTSNWNNKLDMEVDGDIENELQDLSSVLDNGMDANNESIINLSQLTIGSESPTTDASIDVSASMGAILFPQLTTAERDSLTPVEGMIVYNNVERTFQGYLKKNFQALNFTDTGTWSIPRTMRSIVPPFIMHQSITAVGNYSISAIDIPTDAWTDMSGVFYILEGDGVGGAVLYTQDIIYQACDNICNTKIILNSPFEVVDGNSYTLKFTNTTSYNMSTYDNHDNYYAGGMAYQNSNPLPNEDIAFIIWKIDGTWVNLYDH